MRGGAPAGYVAVLVADYVAGSGNDKVGSIVGCFFFDAMHGNAILIARIQPLGYGNV